MMSHKKLVNVKIIILSFIVRIVKYDIQQFSSDLSEVFFINNVEDKVLILRYDQHPLIPPKLNFYGDEEMKSSEMMLFDV